MFKIFVNMLLSLILGKLKTFAISVISRLDAETLTNEEKRKAAFAEIKQEAINEGRNLKDSVVNLVVELAYQLVKKN